MDDGKKKLAIRLFFWMNRKKLIIKHSGHSAKLYDTPLYANDSVVTFWMYADTPQKSAGFVSTISGKRINHHHHPL